MIYVGEHGNVVYDETTISESQKASMVAVETLPNPNTPNGKAAVLRADLNTQTVYYDYVDEPKDDELEELKEVVADLTELVLLGGNNE